MSSDDDRKLLAFSQRLQAEVYERVLEGEAGEGSPYPECAFTDVVSEYLSELGAIENPEVFYYEGTGARGAQMSVNGYALSEERDRLVLFATIFQQKDIAMSPLSKEDVVRAVIKARRVFESASEGFHKKMEPASREHDMFLRIHEAMGSIEEVRILVLTNSKTPTKRLENEDAVGTPVKVEVWDVERLFRGMMAELPRDDIEIDFVERLGAPLSCLPIQKSSDDFAAYLAVFPGELLYELYNEFGPRLLELNVRSFLSVSGKVNKGIRRTLSEDPGRFVAFNNGIVVTVNEIITERNMEEGIGIRSVKGLQIVNGGQTTVSIHRSKKVDGVDIKSVLVPAKMIVVDAQQLDAMVGLVSLYANSQNVIQIADFSANDPYHVEVERLSNVIWCPNGQGRWFYERARGQYQVAKTREGTTPAALRRFNERTPPQRKFVKTELAKYINTWDQRPYLVSFGAQKNFEHFMQTLKGSKRADWLPDEIYFKELVGKAILFRAGNRVVKQEKYPAYQANIVTYLIAYLSSRTGGRIDFDLVWAKQEVSTELRSLLKEWSHGINNALRESAGGRMVSEWAKKEDCWEAVRRIDLKLPDELPPELATCTVTGASDDDEKTKEKLSGEDYVNIDTCRKVSGEKWLKIHAWGKKTGKLQKWQVGIAHTLAGYAAAGWDQGPSRKQAKQGVAILRLTEEHLPGLEK